MIVTLFYVILAILGLSFLIFLHELGHYYMARRLGMHVEVFSIGFGKPLYKWKKDGVQWQIGWLLFGGYVKIKEMDMGDDKNPPQEDNVIVAAWNRLKVAFMGPFVNIVFALLAFTLLWAFGGREKKFSEYTHKIGWLDPRSELYAKGVRIGDEILAYNHQPFAGTKDHVSVPMISKGIVTVAGNHIDPRTLKKTPFTYTVKSYPHPEAVEKDILTIGVLQPASYLIYDKWKDDENLLPEGSPMQNSGIRYGDRIVWVDGALIYSQSQLSHLLNEARALLTIQRDNEVILARVPRVKVEDLKLDPAFREELMDWQFEANLKGMRLQNLYVIPYNLTNEGIVESRLKFIDQEKEEEAFSNGSGIPLESPLKEGDRILAVDGFPVTYSYQILAAIQTHAVNIVVQRNRVQSKLPSWKESDALFDKEYQLAHLQALTSRIGTTQNLRNVGNLYLLHPVVPRMRKEILSSKSQALAGNELEMQRKEVEHIKDPEKRAQVRYWLEERDRQLLLGLPGLQDESINYNPTPLMLFKQVFEEIRHTLGALISGSLNPKWMSGPVGIVQVVQEHSRVGLKEALFWLGAISLNLGILNLLPLPVLDGGTICFSLYEIIVGKRLKPKTLERLILPFGILLIGFFIFLTYYDISRLFKSFWH